MKYRIRQCGNRYIAERKVWWWPWQQLRGTGGKQWWCGDDTYACPPIECHSPEEAERRIKTMIIGTGINMAHRRVVRTMPPWSKA